MAVEIAEEAARDAMEEPSMSLHTHTSLASTLATGI
jgi:hypothetical protein